MKKSFVLLLALVVLISGTACYAQNTLLKEKDQVHFTEQVLYGDKSVVEGATVDMYAGYQYQLFWHTTYEVGKNPKETTDYQFYPQQYYETGNYRGGSLEVYRGFGSTLPNEVELQDSSELKGMELAWKELYDKTEPGEIGQMSIMLKDYQDYYNFVVQITLPQEQEEYEEYMNRAYLYMDMTEICEEIAQLEKTGQDKALLKELKKYQKDMENIQNFFKIPVVEDEVYNLAIEKDMDGNVIGVSESGAYGGSSTGNMDFPENVDWEKYDAFSIGLEAVFGDGDCYLSFDPHTKNGKVVDISAIPGGYGIYHFPYDSTKGTIDSENLKLVYALDTDVDLMNLVLDASGKNILLLTVENGRIYMSVIERETMTLTDKFEVGSDEFYFDFWTFEDYMVTYSDTLAVYSIDEAGRYKKEWAVNAAELQEKLDLYESAQTVPNYDSGFDWDGERLLIGNYIYDEYLGRTCNFLLAAIDETGLIYYGKYESSLMTVEMTSNDTDLRDSMQKQYGYPGVIPDTNRERPVIVKWKK